MQKTLLSLLLAACSCSVWAQSGKNAYDKSLADSLGADAYGMKQYILVILKPGLNRNYSSVQQDSLFRGHLKNIRRLAGEGKLVVAGPLKENKQGYEGIFIFNVKTVEEASLLLGTDPAVQAQLLGADLFEWYGSAALPMYLPYHSKVQKDQF